MTYEKFAVSVEKTTGLDRKTITKTAKRLIFILGCGAIIVGNLIGFTFDVSPIFCSIILFLILIFSCFAFIAESDSPDTFKRCQKIGKLSPLVLVVTIVCVILIAVIIG